MGYDISDEELIATARQVVAEGRAQLRDAKDTRGKAVDGISARGRSRFRGGRLKANLTENMRSNLA